MSDSLAVSLTDVLTGLLLGVPAVKIGRLGARRLSATLLLTLALLWIDPQGAADAAMRLGVIGFPLVLLYAHKRSAVAQSYARGTAPAAGRDIR